MPLKPRHFLHPLSCLLLSAALGCAGPAPEQDAAQSLARDAQRLSTPGLPPGLVPSLVKDIQVGTETQPSFQYKESFVHTAPAPVTLGATLYFTAFEESTGHELWRTDGTEAGTRLIRELVAGPNFEDITGLATVGGSLFISTAHFSPDGTLWKSDGTAEGTVPFAPRGTWKNPGHLLTCDGQLFFQDHQVSSTWKGLWKSDGTLEGTVELSSKEWNFQTDDTKSYFTCAGGKLFFVARDASWNLELWTSDGTPEGTRPLATLGYLDEWGDPTLLFAAGSRVFIPTHMGLWTSDGTAEGTTLLHAESSAEPLFYLRFSTSVGGTFYFTATDALHRTWLWASDGTEEGTRRLMELSWGQQPAFVSLEDTLLFSVGEQLYRSNGTPEGTLPLGSFPMSPTPGECARLPDGRWLLAAQYGPGTWSLWVTDGSSAGTTRFPLAQGQDFTRIQGLTRHGDLVLFWADDSLHGMEPWVTDGTPTGTRLLRDIARADSSTPRSLMDLGGTLLFTAYDAGHGRELWKSDGTAEGTVLLADLGSTVFSQGPSAMTRVGERVFFFSQGQLWKTDGTSAGTQRVRTGFGSVSATGGLGTSLFFGSWSSAHGWELWKSDGTAGGTVLVKDIHPGAGGANPAALTQVGSTLFFSASDGAHGNELWKTDGTPEGTVLLKDIRPGRTGSEPSGLVSAGGMLFFFANDGLHGQQLWKSDGTAEGTVLVADVHRDPYMPPTGMVAREGTVFFLADDGLHGKELWRSDGTAGGTQLVADIAPGPAAAFPLYSGVTFYDTRSGPLYVIDGMLYFAADDGVHGTELWKSDGTAAGTALLSELTPGAGGSPLRDTPLVAVGKHGAFAFEAPDATGGLELWTSDGTAEGTRPLYDLAPGAPGSSPASLTVSGSRLFFVAGDGEYGRELWSVKQAAFNQRP